MESASTQEDVTAVNARSASRLMQEVSSVRVNILLHLMHWLSQSIARGIENLDNLQAQWGAAREKFWLS